MRIIVVSEDPLARAGLVNLLQGRSEIEVIAQHAGDESLSAAFDALLPDALVWDLGGELDSTEWKDGLTELVEAGASVVALLASSAQAAGVWAGGARGLLSREAAPDRIVAAAAAVANGLVAVDPEFAAQAGLEAAAEPLLEALTERERQVLGLMAEGLANKSIALRLEITEHTVKFHVNSILRKLGAQSRTEAVVRATRLGLILL